MSHQLDALDGQALIERCRHGTDIGRAGVRQVSNTATVGLPMYDIPELRAATDAWWSGLARALRREGIAGVPDVLARTPRIEDIWNSEDLLLSQACGYNLVDGWRDRLAYVATPCYTAPGCDGPFYSSVILVRAESSA